MKQNPPKWNLFSMNESVPLTLVVVTYNSPVYLSLTFKSILAQSVLPEEIIVADDGSTEPTREVIDRFREGMNQRSGGKTPVVHIWHPDEGFRRSAILNKAVAAASGRYIVQVDGDLVLHPHFIADHRRAASQGCYVAGSRVNVGEQKARQTADTGDIRLSVFSRGMTNFFNGLRIPRLQKPMSRYHIGSIYHARGCNLAYWREDFLRVNGYDERMTGWGWEDTELLARMRHAGVESYALKYKAITYHLYHRESSREQQDRNREMFLKTLHGGVERCPEGVDKYLVG